MEPQMPAFSPKAVKRAWLALGAGIVLLAIGTINGLFFAPPEHYMGDVYRILYIHVPTAWNAMLALTFAFFSALAFLWKNDWAWDARLEASVEMGVLLSLLLCVQGAIWAKPTWGVWWDWDPRLTTTAVMLVAFVGILALRHFVDDPRRRAIWSSVATVVAYASVPIVYFSVRWWNSLHQLQSSPQTVDSPMITPLRINAFGMLLLLLAFTSLRSQIARRRLARELAPPPSPAASLALGGER